MFLKQEEIEEVLNIIDSSRYKGLELERVLEQRKTNISDGSKDMIMENETYKNNVVLGGYDYI